MEFYEGKLLSNASALPTPEQRYSVATFPQALLLLLWRAPMIGNLFFVENRTFLLCIDRVWRPMRMVLSSLTKHWGDLDDAGHGGVLGSWVSCAQDLISHFLVSDSREVIPADKLCSIQIYDNPRRVYSIYGIFASS